MAPLFSSSFQGSRPSQPGPSRVPPRATLGGKGLPTSGKGKAIPTKGFKRHRKIIKDTIRGISKGDIRRLARRGGVKRMSSDVYTSIREAMVSQLRLILGDCVVFIEHYKRKTVTVTDVIFALRRQGRPIYGFGEARNERPERPEPAQRRG